MTTHPHLEGLIRKWRELAPSLISSQEVIFLFCADELEAAFAALPGGGVERDEFERGYTSGYRAALGAAAAECRRIGEALDGGGNTYVRYEDAIKCAVSVSGLRVPSLTPTPNPHEADRNG